MLETLKLKDLRMDFQPFECLFEERVTQIMFQLKAGVAIPPLTVRFDGESYFLQDGFHRVEAALRCSFEELAAEVSPGTLEDMEREFRAMLRTSL